MKIGIVDDNFFSLQDYALRQGHDVYVVVAGNPGPIGDGARDFAVYPYDERRPKGHGKLQQVDNLDRLLEEECDLYIIGTQNGEPDYERTKLELSIRGKRHVVPVMGYDRYILELEGNRDLAFRLNRSLGLDKMGLRNPEQLLFRDNKLAAKALLSSKKNFVIKQHAASPAERDRSRTVLTDQRTKRAAAERLLRLDASNPFFREDGSGGCVFEGRAEGLEVSFGAFFDGTKFIGQTYLYEEHKGAWDGNLGGLLTGEVGTTMSWFPLNAEKRVTQILRQLESVLEGHCVGMIDINCILDAQGILWFLEYTTRFGRPTLEMQLASQGASFDLLRAWEQLCVPDCAPDRTHSVGVTAFGYGCPLVEEGKYKYPIDWPVVQARKGEAVQQLFATYSNAKRTWEASSGDRQFVSVGTSVDTTLARTAAYAPLKNYSAHELVWRSDVGANTEKLLAMAYTHGLV